MPVSTHVKFCTISDCGASTHQGCSKPLNSPSSIRDICPEEVHHHTLQSLLALRLLPSLAGKACNGLDNNMRPPQKQGVKVT